MSSITFSGPLFDGTADAALRDGIIAARKAVADQGARLTQAAFGSAIRAGTGRFLGSVTVTGTSRTYSTDGYTMAVTADLDEDIVTTSIASYGPWLEGTGSRNETTRFKGYFGFRMAAQELDGQAGRVFSDALSPYVDRMN